MKRKTEPRELRRILRCGAAMADFIASLQIQIGTDCIHRQLMASKVVSLVQIVVTYFDLVDISKFALVI
jgi:hypothetical protein